MLHNRILFLPAAAGALLVLVVAALLFIARPAAHKRDEGSSKERPLPAETTASRQELPEYHLAELNQRELAPDELRHGRVLLVFLTTGCEACVKDLDVVSRLSQDAPPDLRVYGVSFERPAQVETFVKEFGLKFPLLIDIGGRLTRGLDLHYFPSKYLIEDGVITNSWRGTTKDEAELRRQLGYK